MNSTRDDGLCWLSSAFSHYPMAWYAEGSNLRVGEERMEYEGREGGIREEIDDTNLYLDVDYVCTNH